MPATNLEFSDYNFVKVEDVSLTENNKEISFYDIEVKDDHTFHIMFGDECVLSHNCDGAHIAGLMINMFQQFWPDLIKEGFVSKLKTPVIVATLGKDKFLEFFSMDEYKDWCSKNPDKKHSMKWYKGLGSWSTKDFKRFLSDKKYIEPFVYNDQSDFDCIDLAFDKSKADDRKDWLLDNEDI